MGAAPWAAGEYMPGMPTMPSATSMEGSRSWSDPTYVLSAAMARSGVAKNLQEARQATPVGTGHDGEPSAGDALCSVQQARLLRVQTRHSLFIV